MANITAHLSRPITAHRSFSAATVSRFGILRPGPPRVYIRAALRVRGARCECPQMKRKPWTICETRFRTHPRPGHTMHSHRTKQSRSPMPHLEFLHALRRAELEFALPFFPGIDVTPRPKILEIGAGTGYQAAALADLGYDVTAIDVDSSPYRAQRVFPVIDYDGKSLPLGSSQFDIVFSSNVLEHVRDIGAFLDETHRVLAPEGRAIHILPTPTWRWWSSAVHYVWLAKRVGGLLLSLDRNASDATLGTPKVPRTFRGFLGTLLPLRHGERGFMITEPYFYRKRWWTREFARHGYDVTETQPVGIFYTASLVFGQGLPIAKRRILARALGSACRLYVLEKKRRP